MFPGLLLTCRRRLRSPTSYMRRPPSRSSPVTFALPVMLRNRPLVRKPAAPVVTTDKPVLVDPLDVELDDATVRKGKGRTKGSAASQKSGATRRSAAVPATRASHAADGARILKAEVMGLIATLEQAKKDSPSPPESAELEMIVLHDSQFEFLTAHATAATTDSPDAANDSALIEDEQRHDGIGNDEAGSQPEDQVPVCGTDQTDRFARKHDPEIESDASG